MIKVTSANNWLGVHHQMICKWKGLSNTYKMAYMYNFYMWYIKNVINKCVIIFNV